MLGGLLARSARRWPDNTAVIFPGKRLSYTQLLHEAQRRAAALDATGVRAGEHVGILMPNSADFLYWMFGCALHGSAAVLINARYKSRELAYVTKHADLRCLVTRHEPDGHHDYLALLRATFPDLDTGGLRSGLASAPLLRDIIVCGGGPEQPASWFQGENGLLENPPALDIFAGPSDATAPCLMLYTSGTTSNPKGCLLSHRMLTTKTSAIVARLAFRENDCQWNPLPLFHLASLLPMFASFATGGAYLSDSHFDAGRAWEQILAHRATILYPAFPTVMSELVTHPAFAELDTRHVRLINNVAPPERLRENMRLLVHSTHISAYGLTEATGISCYSDPDDPPAIRAQRIGRPLDDTLLRIVEQNSGRLCAPGEHGEIQIAGESVFAGYYKAGRENAGAFTADGWLRTGDIGSLDEEGRLAYHGRLKDSLKVGGENVAALEIESLLSAHPAVKLVQVVGVPDDRLEEVVAAFVECYPDTDCDAQSLIDYCRNRVASFKVPRHLRFVTEWPMSATKVQKFRLREQLMAELEDGKPH